MVIASKADDQSSNSFELFEGGIVDEGVGVALANSAHVSSSLHLEISSSSPGSSPRVLDVPEGSSVLDSVSGCQNGVVDVHSGLAAVVSPVDSGEVVLETGNYLEGNSNWSSIVESLCELNLISLGNVEASMTNVSNSNVLSEDTLSILGSVGVGHI